MAWTVRCVCLDCGQPFDSDVADDTEFCEACMVAFECAAQTKDPIEDNEAS